MKKESKALVILLPIVIVADILLFVAAAVLSISQTGQLAMLFSPFGGFWRSYFIIDICALNVCFVLTVTAIVLIAQLIIYRYAGERLARYHKIIAAVLTVAFVVAIVAAVAVPASQYSYHREEFDTYQEYIGHQEPTSEEAKDLLPYEEEFSTKHGYDATIDRYHTMNADYVAVFHDNNDDDMRYICEYFCSDSKTLRYKFEAEMLYYPTANAVTGEQDGVSYTLFYRHDLPYLSDGTDGDYLDSCEMRLEGDDAVMFISLYEVQDVVDENTEAIVAKALEQFRMIES